MMATDIDATELALELSGVTTGYGRLTVVRDVSISVPAGSITALLGANGAGKTTLLNAISGFLPLSAGAVMSYGEDISHMKAHQRVRHGLCHIPEGRGIFRGLSVKENLYLQAMGTSKGAAVERATSAFPVLGRKLQQLAGTLSGGEQQMLALSAAFIRDPQLILVDEGSLGLAPLVVNEIFDFLWELTNLGKTLMIVDQFAGRVLARAEKAYVLRRGAIVFAGSGQELAQEDIFQRYVGDGASR